MNRTTLKTGILAAAVFPALLAAGLIALRPGKKASK
jgi:hypothetical protein